MSATTVHCDACDLAFTSDWRRKHERTAGHQKAAPLYAASRAEEAEARRAGFERLISFDFAQFRPTEEGLHAPAGHDRETLVLDALGIRTLALTTGMYRGGRQSHRFDELWTERWAANIANWLDVDVGTRAHALARVAADPSLREHLRDWPAVIGKTVKTVGLEIQGGEVFLVQPREALLAMRGAQGSFEINFNTNGQIVEIRPTHWPQHLEMPMPPLHVMINVQTAIDRFAQCSAIIRWLAGAP